MGERRDLKAERLCRLLHLGKVRPISGLEAVFQFLFLIPLKHSWWFFDTQNIRRSIPNTKSEHARWEAACARQNPPGITRTLTHMLTQETAWGADSVLARLPSFIRLLKKKKGRKHSGDYLSFLTRRPADRLISHWVLDACLPRVSPWGWLDVAQIFVEWPWHASVHAFHLFVPIYFPFSHLSESCDLPKFF